MSLNIKTIMKSGDLHCVVNAKTNMAVVFTAKGEKLKKANGDNLTFPAFPWGQHDDWRSNAGDTPPGLYKAGLIYEQIRGRDAAHICNAYGPFCIDMIDLEGQESSNGRAGISMHAGGSGLPDPWAPYQPLTYTHGCIRVHTKDLTDVIVPLIRKTQKAGYTFYITVLR